MSAHNYDANAKRNGMPKWREREWGRRRGGDEEEKELVNWCFTSSQPVRLYQGERRRRRRIRRKGT